MSESMREARRACQRERLAWQDVLAYGEANAKRLGIKNEQEVVRMVRESRQQRGNTQEPKLKTIIACLRVRLHVIWRYNRRQNGK